MKVMYFIHALDVAGAEKICTQYLLELKRRKIDVILIVIAHRNNFLEDELKRNGIRVVSIHPFMPTNIFFSIINSCYSRLISLDKWWDKIIDEEKPDLIHIHTYDFRYFRAKKYPASKLIYTFHGHVKRYMNIMGIEGRNLIRRYANEGMKFFALSSDITREIRAALKTENIVYIPNGVQIENIKNGAYTRDSFLASINIPTDSFIMGHIARFNKEKNQERTIKIFKEVLKYKSNAYLIFIGNCDNKYGKYVKKIVSKESISKRVKFLGVRDDATNIMSIFDAIVLPSLTESFSLVMVEAQAQNVRAVASMSVPESVICNDNCFRLSLSDNDDVWAKFVTGSFTEHHNYKLQDFAMKNVIDKLLNEYNKSVDRE